MHFIQAKTILSSSNGMNLYRGCTHGCIYCDSRSTCYQMDHAFEDVAVKQNSLELLEKALKSKRSKCMIGTGSMADPYMPIEKERCLTREALKLIDKYDFGATLITKSDLVLRDLDILSRINSRTKAVVQMTLTTHDDQLCRIIEPNVCVTSRRFEVLKELEKAKIPTVVWLCPILPYINDTAENIEGLIYYCVKAHVKGILNFGIGLTLREGNREYYYSQLDRHFPGLKQTYMSMYADSYEVGSPKAKTLSRLFHNLCTKYGIMHDNRQIFQYLNTYECNLPPVQPDLFS